MTDAPPPRDRTPDEARRELRRRLAAGWSTRFAVRAAVTVLVLFLLVNAVVALFNPGWRTQLTFGTERTTVEVVSVDADAVGCGRYSTGDRLTVTWTDDGAEQRGTLECLGSPDVGDRLTAYPVAGERGYDWPPYEFWVFTLVVSLLAGAAVGLLRAVLRGFRDDATT